MLYKRVRGISIGEAAGVNPILHGEKAAVRPLPLDRQGKIK